MINLEKKRAKEGIGNSIYTSVKQYSTTPPLPSVNIE